MMLRLLSLGYRSWRSALAARRASGPARPSWSLSFETTVRFLKLDFEEMKPWDYPRIRADLERRPGPKDALRKVQRKTGLLGTVPTETFSPPKPSPGAVLFLHGGSYLFGSTQTHADLIARMALGTGVEVVGANYRLAPEHRYPAALDDALEAFEVLARERDGRVVLAGDSAGGNLALATAMALRDRGMPCPAALISPWLDLTHSQPSYQRNARTDYGSKEMLDHWARDVAGPLDPGDPRLSLLHTDPRGLGPLLIQTGDAELLHDSALEYAARARAAGVAVALEIYRDLPHNPPVLSFLHPEARRALDDLNAFLRKHLGVGHGV